VSTPRYPSVFQRLGPALRSGQELNAAFSYPFTSSEYGIVALGATQATAFQLRAGLNQLATVAANTGVKLPQPSPGEFVVVFNDGANPLTVYPYAGELIDGAVSVPLANAKRCIYFCFMNDAGVLLWESAQLGVASA